MAAQCNAECAVPPGPQEAYLQGSMNHMSRHHDIDVCDDDKTDDSDGSDDDEEHKKEKCMPPGVMQGALKQR